MKKPTFVKLEDGSWGIQMSRLLAKTGTTVELTNRAGEVSTLIIKEVLFSTDRVSYCTFEKAT